MEKDHPNQNQLATLPTEILQHLLSYVSTREHLALLHVCRALSHPYFWRSLYSNIHLNDLGLYNKFITTITQSAKGKTFIRDLGQYVETLTIFSEYIVTNKETVATLQRLCPNVTYFDTSRVRRPNPSTLPTAQPWTSIQRISWSLYSDVSLVAQHAHHQLTHLSICDLYTEDGSPIFALSFPHLVDLVVGPEEFTTDMLTDIITACPALQHFTLDGVTLPTLRGVLTDWDTVVPMVCLKHLELQHVDTGELLWLKMVGHAFPMLDTLTINHLTVFAPEPVMGDDTVEINSSDDERDYMESSFDLMALRKAFLGMLDTLKHLVRTQLLYVGYNYYPLGGYFLLRHLIANGKQLEDLQFDYSCKDSLEDSDLLDFDDPLSALAEPQFPVVIDYIKSTANTLRTFYFYMNYDLYESQRLIINALADCTWLHTLVLQFPDAPYSDLESVDLILDTLPNLKSLEYPTQLAPEPVVLSERSCVPLHGLTRLVFKGKIRTLSFLKYIHMRCPNLRVLHLNAAKISCQHNLVMDFPNWHLQELDLGSTGENVNQMFRFNGKNKNQMFVFVRESGPRRGRWYEHTRKGWQLRSDMTLRKDLFDERPGFPSPILVLDLHSIEQMQLFTPSHYHHVF